MSLNFSCDFEKFRAAIFRSHSGYLHGIEDIIPISLDDLVGIDTQKELVVRNIENFLASRVAQNILLWGARGSGKTSLVRAVLLEFCKRSLRIVQVLKTDLWVLDELFDALRIQDKYKFIVLLDDLSFESGREDFKSLKAFLDGGIEAQAKNILICATSNRRHLVNELQSENDLFGYEGEEDKIALSDRFGLSLGFYTSGKEELVTVLSSLFAKRGVDFNTMENKEEVLLKALNFAGQKGSRNPRIVKQFFEMYESGLV